MSTTETPPHPTIHSQQEEAPESAEAIADRILGNTPAIEMSSLASAPQSSSVSNTLPQVITTTNDAPARMAPVPILSGAQIPTDHENVADEPPVSPSDILSRALVITIIITNTDSRHRYVLDDNYLAKRNVAPPEGLITNLSVYKLKELIWRDWRSEWEQRPIDPASIRLIHMGRMLDDTTYLRDNRFQVGETAHVVHMNVRPDMSEEDDGGKVRKTTSRRRTADGDEPSPGCRCVLM